jgi:ABC-type antimicrobial peptide transport system permease subunit
MSGIFWWIRQVILTLAGCFFLAFGIILLISAYQLKDPFWFIMTFFASNLIILISAALLVGFIVQMVSSRKTSDKDDK